MLVVLVVLVVAVKLHRRLLRWRCWWCAWQRSGWRRLDALVSQAVGEYLSPCVEQLDLRRWGKPVVRIDAPWPCNIHRWRLHQSVLRCDLLP
jgi:hypothetical protein